MSGTEIAQTKLPKLSLLLQRLESQEKLHKVVRLEVIVHSTFHCILLLCFFVFIFFHFSQQRD